MNFPEELLKKSVLICSDGIEHLCKPLPLLQKLKDFSPVCILTTPERNLINPCHVREWNMAELRNLLSFVGFNIEFMGLTLNNDKDNEKKTIMAILGNNNWKVQQRAPESFRVVAIMAVYNEADIIVPSIEKLVKEDVLVYVIDNGPTDGTYELVRNLVGKGVIGVERFPKSGPPIYYEWMKLLMR